MCCLTNPGSQRPSKHRRRARGQEFMILGKQKHRLQWSKWDPIRAGLLGKTSWFLRLRKEPPGCWSLGREHLGSLKPHSHISKRKQLISSGIFLYCFIIGCQPFILVQQRTHHSFPLWDFFSFSFLFFKAAVPLPRKTGYQSCRMVGSLRQLHPKFSVTLRSPESIQASLIGDLIRLDPVQTLGTFITTMQWLTAWKHSYAINNSLSSQKFHNWCPVGTGQVAGPLHLHITQYSLFQDWSLSNSTVLFSLKHCGYVYLPSRQLIPVFLQR